jgi:TPR repeat protein
LLRVFGERWLAAIGARHRTEMARRLAIDTAAFDLYLEPGEQLKYIAYGVKQPNIILIVIFNLMFIIPGILLVMLGTKQYMVGLTDRRFIILPFSNGIIKLLEVVAYRLNSLAPVIASTGPLFTHIKILDPSKRFVAKFHRHAFAGQNREFAMAIAAELTRAAPDLAQAMQQYRKAADRGDADAQNNIGQLYSNGSGVPRDYAQAMQWYRKAADQGNSRAQDNIGVLYAGGRGVAQDYAQAMEWYRKAADQGHANAQNNIGTFYQLGQGVTQDYALAMQWYLKAADQGNSRAQNNIGSLYENGSGLPQDYALAMEWFRKAADQGEIAAQYNVGLLYANGRGVARDTVAAYNWTLKAAAGGDQDAKKWLAVNGSQVVVRLEAS